MKKLLLIIFSFYIFFSIANAAEKKDCKEFKKFTKEHMTCIAENLKNITLKGTNKVKKDINIAADEVKDDATKVKNKTEKLIKKSKEKLN